jgi:hypothetical protein
MLCAIAAAGCHEPDPRTVEGAIDAVARAVELRDGRALYRVLDQRARHALISVVEDRQASAALIRADYPPELRGAALQELGDAVQVLDAAGLFAARCPEACLAELAQKVGAPVAEERAGRLVHVRTARGTTLDMYAGDDAWYGLVWNTAELSHERNEAARQRVQIGKNAEIYRRRRQLEAASGSAPPSGAAPAPAAE